MNNAGTRRRFLRSNVGEPEDEQEETDRSKGVPAPPAEKPCPEVATLIDLTSPEDLKVGRMPLIEAIRRRSSRRQYTKEPLSLEELSFLLWASQGVRKVLRKGFSLRTVPRGGLRHPFETYLSVHRVAGLSPGLYRYLPLEHKLCLLFLDDRMAERTRETCAGRFVGEGAVVFIWTAVPYRREWGGRRRQRERRAGKNIAVEAGHVCQNLYLACEAIGAGTCAVGGYLQDKVDALLGVNGEDEFAVYVAPVGKVERGQAEEWSGHITRVETEGQITRLWLRAYSPMDGAVVVEFPSGDASTYVQGDEVVVRAELVDLDSQYGGMFLAEGISIKRQKKPPSPQ